MSDWQPSDPPPADPSGPDSTAFGFGRILVAAYAVFALAATARSSYQLLTKGSQAPLAYGLSAVAAVVYLIATWALATNRRRVAMWAVAFEAVGVVTIGALSLISPGWFDDETVWSAFGRGYGFIPFILPWIGLWWLWRSELVRRR